MDDREKKFGRVWGARARSVGFGILLLTTQAPAAHAQALTGRVTEAGTGASVSAALVELLDVDSTQVAATLSGADGRYLLEPALAGTYTVRIRRLGYASRTVGPLDLATSRELDLTLDTRPVELEGVVATARPACADGPGVGPETRRLWDLVVGALDVTRLAQQLEAYRFDMHQYVRDIDIDGLHVLAEGIQRTAEAGAFAAIPLDRLEDQGYLEPDEPSGMSWYMPDPEVLVSDRFLRTHCFRVVVGPDDRVVGLGFEPTPDRIERRPAASGPGYDELAGDEIVEVRGVLWVDRETGALRDMEYGYVGLEQADIAALAGGYARFEQLEGGVWIVRQWILRMPNLDLRNGRLVPSSLREVGGYVVDASTAGDPDPGTGATGGGSAIPASAGAELSGQLVEVGVDVGRADAVVRLSGSPRATRVDAEGRFRFSGVPPGPYLVTWWSPRLDSLGLPARGVYVAVEDGETRNVTLPGPEIGWAVDHLCRGMRVDPALGIVRVYAVDDEGAPVSDRIVRLRALEGDLERETVPRGGIATFCSVPTEVPLAVAPVRDPTMAVPLRLGASEVRPLRLVVRRAPR